MSKQEEIEANADRKTVECTEIVESPVAQKTLAGRPRDGVVAVPLQRHDDGHEGGEYDDLKEDEFVSTA